MKALARLLAALGIAALGALTTLGCSADTTDPEGAGNDEDDSAARRDSMKATWLGSWEGELIGPSGASPSFTLQLDYRAPGATPQCGTVELGGQLGLECVTNYRLGVTGTLNTNDGRFVGQSVLGAVELGGLAVELPNGGFLRIDEGGSRGSFSYGNGDREGTVNAHKK